MERRRYDRRRGFGRSADAPNYDLITRRRSGGTSRGSQGLSPSSPDRYRVHTRVHGLVHPEAILELGMFVYQVDACG